MTQKSRTLNVWALTVAMAALSAAAGAQTPAGPVAPKAPQAAQDRYIVGQAKPPEVAGHSPMELTIDDAIQRALDRNIDLKVQRYNPQLTDFQIKQTLAAYKGTLTFQGQYQDRTQFSQATTDGSTPTFATRTSSSTSSYVQPTRFYGLTVTGNFNTSRAQSTQTTSLRPIQFTSGFGFTTSMPLLRNMKTDNTRTTLKTQAITREINDIALKTSIANTIASVRNAYWDLRSAIENIEIQRRALALATQLVEQNRTKVEIGTMAQIDVIQAESQQANAELSLVNAESTWRTAEMTFKKLVAGGTEDEIFNATILPTSNPGVAQTNVDIPAAVTAALSQRTDLATAKKQIESTGFTLKLLENQVLPDLNFSGGYSVAGAGGNQYDRNGNVTSGSGYFDSLTGAYHTPSWNLTANFSYPVGQQASRANLARNRLALEQTKTSLKSTELTVTTDVTNAGLSVQNAYKSLMASQKARELAERQAEAEQTKFDVGMSTNFTVVQQQQALTTARLAELRAILTYVKALIEFERVQNVGR